MDRVRSNSGGGRLDRIAYRRAARQRRRSRGAGAHAGGFSWVQWLGLAVAALPGLAAAMALLFSSKEVRVAEQGQITSRFNSAISNLGSASLDVRFGGIYALERIMQDSPRDQPRIVAVLSAYARRHAPVPASGFAKEPEDVDTDYMQPPTDVVAVMKVLANRRSGRDGGAQLDWTRTDLRGLQLFPWDLAEVVRFNQGGGLPSRSVSAPFRYAIMVGADLRHAWLAGVDLRNAFASEANLSSATFLRADLAGASLESADLTRTNFVATDLTSADLSSAKLSDAQFAVPTGVFSSPTGPCNLTNAELWDADLRAAGLDGTNLTGAFLVGADLKGASLIGANLHGAKLSAADKSLEAKFFFEGKHANLTGADLTGADLTNADLRGVNLTRAILTNADLRGARLTGAKFTKAKTNGARGLPPSLASD